MGMMMMIEINSRARAVLARKMYALEVAVCSSAAQTALLHPHEVHRLNTYLSLPPLAVEIACKAFNTAVSRPAFAPCLQTVRSTPEGVETPVSREVAVELVRSRVFTDLTSPEETARNEKETMILILNSLPSTALGRLVSALGGLVRVPKGPKSANKQTVVAAIVSYVEKSRQTTISFTGNPQSREKLRAGRFTNVINKVVVLFGPVVQVSRAHFDLMTKVYIVFQRRTSLPADITKFDIHTTRLRRLPYFLNPLMGSPTLFLLWESPDDLDQYIMLLRRHAEMYELNAGNMHAEAVGSWHTIAPLLDLMDLGYLDSLSETDVHHAEISRPSSNRSSTGSDEFSLGSELALRDNRLDTYPRWLLRYTTKAVMCKMGSCAAQSMCSLSTMKVNDFKLAIKEGGCSVSKVARTKTAMKTEEVIVLDDEDDDDNIRVDKQVDMVIVEETQSAKMTAKTTFDDWKIPSEALEATELLWRLVSCQRGLISFSRRSECINTLFTLATTVLFEPQMLLKLALVCVVLMDPQRKKESDSVNMPWNQGEIVSDVLPQSSLAVFRRCHAILANKSCNSSKKVGRRKGRKRKLTEDDNNLSDTTSTAVEDPFSRDKFHREFKSIYARELNSDGNSKGDDPLFTLENISKLDNLLTKLFGEYNRQWKDEANVIDTTRFIDHPKGKTFEKRFGPYTLIAVGTKVGNAVVGKKARWQLDDHNSSAQQSPTQSPRKFFGATSSSSASSVGSYDSGIDSAASSPVGRGKSIKLNIDNEQEYELDDDETNDISSEASFRPPNLTHGVEDFVLNVLTREGRWKGMHTESSVILSLFGLIMEDIMFFVNNEVTQTTFVGPIQNRPLDMDEPGIFYEHRKLEVDRRLAEVAAGHYKVHIDEAYSSSRWIMCDRVRWDLERDDILEIADAIGGIRLARLCKLIAMNHRVFQSGFPDICVWRDKTSKGKKEISNPTDEGFKGKTYVKDEASSNEELLGKIFGKYVPARDSEGKSARTRSTDATETPYEGSSNENGEFFFPFKELGLPDPRLFTVTNLVGPLLEEHGDLYDRIEEEIEIRPMEVIRYTPSYQVGYAAGERKMMSNPLSTEDEVSGVNNMNNKEIAFLDIKGHKDRLSDIQIIWMWYLARIVKVPTAEFRVVDNESWQDNGEDNDEDNL